MMTMRELAKKSHGMAVEKGWYEMFNGRPLSRPMLQVICLFHSEVSEILEAYRDPNHRCDEIWFTDSKKPEGVVVEIADLFIRIADTAEIEQGFDVDFFKRRCALLLDRTANDAQDLYYQNMFCSEFGYVIGEKTPSLEMMVFISHKLLSEYDLKKDRFQPSYWGALQKLLIFWSIYCQYNHLDLEKAIELKMAYNSTRPIRHGNKRL